MNTRITCVQTYGGTVRRWRIDTRSNNMWTRGHSLFLVRECAYRAAGIPLPRVA